MQRIALRVILLLALPASCLATEPLRIGVSVLPLETLVRSIGGESVEVRSLQQEGDSCSVFEPRPSVIAWLSGADLFFRVGAGFEPVILEKLDQQFPSLEVLDLRDAVEVLPLGDHHHHGHDHQCSACAHDHGATDPHLWLDPVRLAAMGHWVAEELGRRLPGEKEAFLAAADALSERLTAIHRQLEANLLPLKGSRFYIYHPALGYFADRYGLEQVAIAPTDEGPSARQLHQLVARARADGVRFILVQPQESRRQAQILAEAVGAELVEIDPMCTDLEGNLLTIGGVLSGSGRND